MGKEISSAYCPTCGATVSPYELVNCRCHICQGQKLSIDYFIRVGQYESVLRDMILSLKYHNKSHLDRFLGKLAGAAALSNKQFRTADMFVPIPLHWRRRMARGYNQSELLAREAARELSANDLRIPVVNALKRIKNTHPQALLTQAGRRENLKGAFAVRNLNTVKNKHICLVDDVTTSGSTLHAAARELRKAGADKIGVLVLCVPDRENS
ncbi:MAG: ComF family protein [Sedimentisphaerales bacterium]|nr:ComF family protein [Sedimentisphaerales bacterium]